MACGARRSRGMCRVATSLDCKRLRARRRGQAPANARDAKSRGARLKAKRGPPAKRAIGSHLATDELLGPAAKASRRQQAAHGGDRRTSHRPPSSHAKWPQGCSDLVKTHCAPSSRRLRASLGTPLQRFARFGTGPPPTHLPGPRLHRICSPPRRSIGHQGPLKSFEPLMTVR